LVDVLPGDRLAAAACAAGSSEQVPEYPGEAIGAAASEQVLHLGRIAGVGSASKAARPVALRPGRFRLLGELPIVAIAVVLRAFFLVRQYLVRFGDFLEALLRSLVVRFHIRVELARKPPVRLPNVLLGGVALDAKDVVVIAFR